MRIAIFEEVRLGESAAIEFQVTEQHVAQFASLSLDDNQLHVDDDFARSRGFSGRVAHGMLALSAFSRLIGTQLPGHGSLWVSQQLQFTEPVMIGDTLRASVTVEQISKATEGVILATEVINTATKAIVLRGKAAVRVPRPVTESLSK